LFIEVSEHHGGAGLGKCPCGDQPNASCGTRNRRNLALK
jgi:hypothetical protein